MMLSTLRLAVMSCFGMLALASAASAQCYDCECDAQGLWQAWDPQAAGHWSDGTYEPGINVRRCRELNGSATGGVCRRGDLRNIYQDRAPAITSPRCQIGPGPDDGDGGGGGGGGGDQGGGGNGVDRYSPLLQLFDDPSSTAPTLDELGTFWAGRCYREDARSVARAGVLFVQRPTSDNGPLFPREGEPRLYLLEHTSSTNAFDELSREELDEIMALVRSPDTAVTPATVTGNALRSYFMPSDQTPVLWSARKVTRDGQVYYASQAALARASGEHPQGYVFMACYHYQRAKMPE